MQHKNTCKRCKHLDEAKGYGKFNHYCKQSLEIIADDEIGKKHCANFEHKSLRAAVSLFKYILGDDGKYYRYYLSDEEAQALFERRQQTAVNKRIQNSRSTL